MTRPKAPVCASLPRELNAKSWHTLGKREHFVQFYRTDDYLIECLASYVAKALWEGDNALVIATTVHRFALEDRLRTKNVDVAHSTVTGAYVSLDAREVLGKFSFAGRPNREAFFRLMRSLIREMPAAGKGLSVFGEMVALLWLDDFREGALELEQLWNELARDSAFSLFCAYPADCVTAQPGRPGLQHICEQHASVISLSA